MTSHNIDPEEIAKFTRFAAHWWDPEGEMKPLHALNPLRLAFIMDNTTLRQNKVIDIGCGGGILTESMAKNGAAVTGIDMSPEAIKIAKLHQLESQLAINYQVETAETHALHHAGEYDSVTCMEMLEHVPDPAAIIRASATLVKKGGDVFVSTLNRNVKSYLFAIIGAEYLLKLLPKNTHDFAKFIRPSELAAWGRQSGLTVANTVGIHYHPFTKKYTLSDDISVNYLMHFKK